MSGYSYKTISIILIRFRLDCLATSYTYIVTPCRYCVLSVNGHDTRHTTGDKLLLSHHECHISSVTPHVTHVTSRDLSHRITDTARHLFRYINSWSKFHCQYTTTRPPHALQLPVSIYRTHYYNPVPLSHLSTPHDSPPLPPPSPSPSPHFTTPREACQLIALITGTNRSNQTPHTMWCVMPTVTGRL